jgi:molybdopterin/thiamine biosynthesis adenylyltransferase
LGELEEVKEDELDEEEEPEDRYTRLKAIKEFGYDIKWEDLFNKKVVIAGVGGLGIVSAEMLARCGIGTLYLFDRDIIAEVNLNRMGFMKADLGESKVGVIAKSIRENINPDVKVIAHHGDIMYPELEDIFDNAVKDSDLVLMGMDNFPARMFVNQKCLNHRRILIDAGVSRSALSGNVHPVYPGKNACMQCTARLKGTNEKKERGKPCTASLPTSMSIIASLQVQQALKILLKFGDVVDYLSYNALTGDFARYKTKRDTNCAACGFIDDEIKEETFDVDEEINRLEKVEAKIDEELEKEKKQ